MAAVSPDGYDYIFKVIVIGDKGVGKTSLLRRFCYKSFDIKSTHTIGVDFLVNLLISIFACLCYKQIC